MSTNLKLGNLVTPKGASLIFGAEATDDFLDIKTTNDETNNPYTIVIEEEDGEEIIPAEYISYSAGADDGALTSTTAQDAISELNQKTLTMQSSISGLEEKTTTAQDAISELNQKTLTMQSSISGLEEKTTTLTKFFTIDNSLPLEILDGYFYSSQNFIFSEISVDPNLLRAHLVVDQQLLSWMSECKIPALYLIKNKTTGVFKIAWLNEGNSKRPSTVGITVDILDSAVTSYEELGANLNYYVVDAVGGGGGLGGSFIVTYGETPIDEVISAVEDNLNVTMLVEGKYAPLVRADIANQKFVFSLDFLSTANPTAIDSRKVYILDSNGYSSTTYSNFSFNLYKTNNTPIDASKGYLRPIRVSTNLPTNTDGNVGDLWIVIGG